MEFWRYYRIIRRRRWLILLGMAICVGVVAYSNTKSVQSFTGRTTLMESTGMSKEGVPLFPEQLMQVDVQLRLSNLANIASSLRVRQRTAEALMDFGLPEERAREILSRTDVHPERDTNILAVEITLPAEPMPGETREQAEERTRSEATNAADIYAAEFKKVYAELNNSSVSQSREFIEAQLATTRKSMVAAQNALRDYKEKNGIVELSAQSQALVQRLESTKAQLAQAEAAYRSAISRTEKQGTELKGLPEWEKMGETTALNPEWQQLRQQLVQLETAKAAKMGNKETGKAGWGANNPEAQALQKQIDDTNEQLRVVAEKNTQYLLTSKTEAKSTVQQNALDRWISAKVDEVGSAAQLDVMNNEVERVRSEMSGIPEQEAKYAELETDVQAATQTYGLMRSKLDEARIKEEQTKNEVALKTIDPAYSDLAGSKQSMKLILALILSPILGIAVAFLLYYTDNTVKTAAEAEKLLGLPVLCAIPESRAHSFSRQRCPEIMDVAYQMLTSNIWIASQNHNLNGLVVVSAEPNVGRSVTASNLAISLAREGARVVLVDADLRQPTQHLLFGTENRVGLTNVLAGGATIEDVLVPTKVPGLLLVPTGPVPENPVKLLRSEQMKTVDEQIKDVADFVIYDTPAGVTFPDPVLVAAHVGAAVVVHSAGRVPRGSEADLHARLASVGVNMLGAVLNKVKREDSSSYFHYRRSYQGISTAQLPGGKKAALG